MVLSVSHGEVECMMCIVIVSSLFHIHKSECLINTVKCDTVELSHNVMNGTEYFVLLYMMM